MAIPAVTVISLYGVPIMTLRREGHSALRFNPGTGDLEKFDPHPISRIGPRTCWCCGKAERQSGCVLGPSCSCGLMLDCFRCGKCPDHCQCTKAQLFEELETLRRVWAQALTAATADGMQSRLQKAKDRTTESGK